MFSKLILAFATASVFCQATISPSIDKGLMDEWFHHPDHIVIELDPIQTLIQYGNNPKCLRPLEYAIETKDYEASPNWRNGEVAKPIFKSFWTFFPSHLTGNLFDDYRLRKI